MDFGRMPDISTAFSCSGHLYESCFSPYIMFDGPYDENGQEFLTFYRGILLEWNDQYQANISEIEHLWNKYVFTVRANANQCEKDPKQRLQVQSDFINYLYDIAEFIPSDIFEKHVCASAEI